MGQLDQDIFGGKKFSDLLEEIYNNQKKRDAQVTALISELKPLIKEIGDATSIVPLIKEYMEIGVKNDEHLIKLATVVQRIETAAAKGGGDEFDFSDLQALLEEQEEVDKQIESTKEDNQDGIQSQS